jgi:hypothetical protein
MENNRYRLKEDKLIGNKDNRKILAHKNDVVTVISVFEGADGLSCIVSREKDDNRFSVLAKLLTPII